MAIRINSGKYKVPLPTQHWDLVTIEEFSEDFGMLDPQIIEQLAHIGIYLMGDLPHYAEEDLAHIRALGPKKMSTMRAHLHANGAAFLPDTGKPRSVASMHRRALRHPWCYKLYPWNTGKVDVSHNRKQRPDPRPIE